MTVPNLQERWKNPINKVTIGATSEDGGTRGSTVTIGGGTGLPFLGIEGETPCKPVVAMDVYDIPQDEWTESAIEPFKDVMDDPAKWAQKCKDYGAELICLRLKGIHPDFGNKGKEYAAEVTRKVLEAVDLPLVVLGCDIDDIDNDCLPSVAEAGQGENLLIGYAKEKNYATLAAACKAYDHKIAAFSPIDINIAKQLNILLSEADYPLENIVIYPSTGGLGYGIEYCYSIVERGRVAALTGDKLLAQPVMGDVGEESWKTKESKSSTAEAPQWGTQPNRGIMWEVITANMLLQSGTDLLLMRHPEAVKVIKETIANLMNKGK